VIAAEKHEESFAMLCRGFGVSRRVGYKWLDAIGRVLWAARHSGATASSECDCG